MIPNRDFLSWLLNRHATLGALTEIRCLRLAPDGQKGIWSGYFGPEHLDRLITDLSPLEEGPRDEIPPGGHPRSGEANIYFSMQGIDPERIRGHVGRLRRASQTTRDSDVGVYGLFAVDLDPVRPTGHSATDDEKAAARLVAEGVGRWFEERGITPRLADSGNGYHLLIPVTPRRGVDVLKAALQAHALLKLLDARFSTDAVKVDTSIFNPSRILKLYGTLAIKGDSSPERPHRESSVAWASPVEEVDLFAILAEELKAQLEVPTWRGGARQAPRRAPSHQTPRSENRSDEVWQVWRRAALARLDLKAVYGGLLTGRNSGPGWLECRDPSSPSGDQNPSAGVADGTGEAERGSFHSFRTGESLSVFDFLYREGKAADFAAARRMVARLSGIPLPRALVEPPDSNEDAAGPPRKATLAEQPTPQVEVVEPVARPTVDFVTNADSVAALFDRLLGVLLPMNRLFAGDGGLLWVEPGQGTMLVTERVLPGLLSGHLDLRFLRDTGKDVLFSRFGVLPFELARTFVADPRIRASLPPLALHTRSPLFAPDWTLIATRGYHAACGGVWYDGPTIHPAEGDPRRLLDLLTSFNWHKHTDLVNTLGVLLTTLTMPHWGRGHPFVALNGNKPGCGKTTLARLLGALTEGREPSTVTFTPDDAELEKQLATRVEAGDRFIVLDNVKARAPLSCPVLERSITDGRPTFRRLGTNAAISRSTNDLLFCLTMNDTRLGPDLRRRALPINLVLETDARDAAYPLADIVGRALDDRPGLLAELAGLVARWLDAGRPQPADAPRHSTNQSWASTIGAILHHNRFDGFLTNLDDAERAFDADHELLSDVVALYGKAPPAFAAEWVGRLEEAGLDDLCRDPTGREKSARGKATAIGQFFAGRVGQVVTVEGVRYRLTRQWPRGEGWKAEYGFEVL